MDADHFSKHFRRLLGNLPVNLPVNYFSIYPESIPIAYKQEMLDCRMKCDRKCQEKSLSGILPEQTPVKPNAMSCHGQRWEGVGALGRSAKPQQPEIPERALCGAGFPLWDDSSHGCASS